ncbi:hypothetical protein TRVL_07114 [Trypanosoma vivax]|nr:hypothetical protein TRVL_07114 [Trypanosoma vivax]
MSSLVLQGFLYIIGSHLLPSKIGRRQPCWRICCFARKRVFCRGVLERKRLSHVSWHIRPPSPDRSDEGSARETELNYVFLLSFSVDISAAVSAATSGVHTSGAVVLSSVGNLLEWAIEQRVEPL